MSQKFQIIFYLVILLNLTLYGWEVNTHRAIDRCAITNECGGDGSKNLHQFVTDSEIKNDNYKNEEFEGYTTEKFFNSTTISYFDYVTKGEKYGVSKWNQKFEHYDYKDLIEAGTILEDSLWKGLNRYIVASKDPDGGRGRFGNHFYDPQNDGDGLSIAPWSANTNAIDWAFEDSKNVTPPPTTPTTSKLKYPC